MDNEAIEIVSNIGKNLGNDTTTVRLQEESHNPYLHISTSPKWPSGAKKSNKANSYLNAGYVFEVVSIQVQVSMKQLPQCWLYLRSGQYSGSSISMQGSCLLPLTHTKQLVGDGTRSRRSPVCHRWNGRYSCTSQGRSESKTTILPIVTKECGK